LTATTSYVTLISEAPLTPLLQLLNSWRPMCLSGWTDTVVTLLHNDTKKLNQINLTLAIQVCLSTRQKQSYPLNCIDKTQ